MALTDLGQVQVGMKCMEHRSMSFLSRMGTLVEARDDARIRKGAPTAQGFSHRQVARGHTPRGAWPEIFALVSNIDMGTSFRVDGHDGAPPGCRSSEFREALDDGQLPPTATTTDRVGPHGYEHIGILVDSAETPARLWSQLADEQIDIHLEPFTPNALGEGSLRLHYLLPMAVEVQFHAVG